MQEKESVMVVQFDLKITSLGITVSLVMPNCYPRHGSFNPNITTIKDSYIPDKQKIFHPFTIYKVN